MRRLAAAIASLIVFGASPRVCEADDAWGGSLGLTSDYLVRGISRSNDQPALQLDLHYSNTNGLLAGIFASNAQIDPRDPRDVELSGFVGFAWNLNEDWQTRILATHYAYPWNRGGTQYDYDEVDLDVAYRSWLHFNVDYSPDTPRYAAYPYDRLIRVAEKSAELSLQRQLIGRLSATAGLGYAFLQGPESGGYVYWSVGGAYDLRSVSLVLSYVDTSAEAKALFYNATATGRWLGTVLWRF
jgi:uncharacterized protein (TIGR02001 family)